MDSTGWCPQPRPGCQGYHHPGADAEAIGGDDQGWRVGQANEDGGKGDGDDTQGEGKIDRRDAKAG